MIHDWVTLTDMPSLVCISITNVKIDGVVRYQIDSSFTLVVVKD